MRPLFGVTQIYVSLKTLQSTQNHTAEVIIAPSSNVNFRDVCTYKSDDHLATHMSKNEMASHFCLENVHFCFNARDIPLYEFGMSFESVFPCVCVCVDGCSRLVRDGERFEWYFGIYPKLGSLIVFQLENPSRFVVEKSGKSFQVELIQVCIYRNPF